LQISLSKIITSVTQNQYLGFRVDTKDFLLEK